MLQINYKYITIGIICLLFINTQCSIKPSDKLVDDLKIHDVKNTFTNGNGFLFTDIVAFPQETFAQILIGTDGNIYVQITQNGQPLSSLLGPLNEDTSNDALTISGCNHQNKLVVVWSQPHSSAKLKRVQRLQYIDLDGNFIGNNIEFSNDVDSAISDQWFGKCISLDENQIGMSWYQYRVAAYYTSYNFLTQSQGPIKIVSDQIYENTWYLNTMTKQKGLDQIIVGWSQRTSTGQVNKFQIVDFTGERIGNNIVIEASTQTSSFLEHPFVEPKDDGGFVFVIFYENISTIKFINYNKDGIQLCNKTISTNKRWPMIVTYKEKTFMSYSESHTDNADYLIPKKAFLAEIDIATCKKLDEVQLNDQDIYFHVHLTIAFGQQVNILGLNYVTKPSTLNELQYTEYFMGLAENTSSGDNSGGEGGSSGGDTETPVETACTNKNCFGCYGSNLDSCPLCAGSTSEKREERKTLSGGDCICPPTHFENNLKDCEICPTIQFTGSNGVCQACDKKCLDCSQSSNNCGNCVDTTRQAPECTLCKTGFYLNEQIQKCEQCDPKCGSDGCIDDFICKSNCSDIIMTPPFCVVPPVGSFYEIDENGMILQKECDKKCETCLQSSQNCLTCKGQNRNSFIDDNTCSCKSGFYDLQGTLQDCLPCNTEKCNECESFQICKTSCKDSSKLMPYCTNSQQGNFVVNINGEMVENQCDNKCESCVNTSDNCLVCKSQLNRNTTPPECNCLEGFYEDEGQCIQITCPQNCLDCSSLICNQCKANMKPSEDLKSCVCKENFNLVQGQCIKNCEKDTQYFDLETLSCQNCKIYVGICMKQCPDETNFNSENNQCEINNSMQSTVLVILVTFVGLLFQNNDSIKLEQQQQDQENEDNL